MKKLIASATVAGLMAGGLLTAGLAGTAGAAGTDEPTTESNAPQPGHGGVRHVALRTAVAAAAESLGMSVEELKAAVPEGSTIAELAASKDVPVATVTDAVVQALNAKLDEAVANGTLTAERAAKAKARIPDLAQRFVDHERGARRGAAAEPAA